MTGFWALTRKEVQEQRRTWKFLAMALVFTLPAILGTTIERLVAHVRDGPHGVEQATETLEGIGGWMIPFLGTFLVVVIAMGSLAQERASGTAAMTLSKPVTRSAFVAAKLLGLTVSIFGAIGIASVVAYVLVLLLYADAGLGRFAAGMAVNAAYLLFVGSIALFWSAMFSRQLLAGGIAVAMVIALQILEGVPHTQRYWPVAGSRWAGTIISGEASDEWPGFLIGCGLIVLLSLAAWAVFRRKEL